MTSRIALRIGRTAVYLVVVAGFLWCLWFAALWMFSDEGAMPPRWRVPAVPAGATVVEDTMMCASGGCWWSVTLTPPAGQSPEDLARQMDLANERILPPTLTDPGFVTVGANSRQGRLVVYVSYRSFPRPRRCADQHPLKVRPELDKALAVAHQFEKAAPEDVCHDHRPRPQAPRGLYGVRRPQ